MNLRKASKVNLVVVFIAICISLYFVGCGVAVMLAPDASQWKETLYSTTMERDEVFKLASQALASIVKIDDSNKDALQIGGECGDVENNVVITVKKGKTKNILSIKSRLLTKVKGGKYAEIGSDRRGDCIQKVLTEMQNLGCELTELKSASK